MTAEQREVCTAFARQLGVQKHVILDQVEEYLEDFKDGNPIAEFEIPGESIRFAVSKNTVGLSALLFIKKLKKTELYSDIESFLNQENALSFLCFKSGNALMVAYAAEGYFGFGGIFVGGFAIEPIANYLEYYFPKQETD